MLYGNQDVTNAFSDVDVVCEKAKALIDQEKYAEAIELLKEEIKKVKKFKVYGLEEYYSFDEGFQFDIFINFLSEKNNAKNKKQRNRACQRRGAAARRCASRLCRTAPSRTPPRSRRERPSWRRGTR